jgi:hypothetical protein
MVEHGVRREITTVAANSRDSEAGSELGLPAEQFSTSIAGQARARTKKVLEDSVLAAGADPRRL